MLKPKSLLPWSITNETDELVDASYYSIFGATHDDTATTDEVDGKYIVQACNNFPKAIELLKEFIFEWENSGSPKYDLDKLSDKVQEFLKSLEKDGE
jgi:hypothetical protein